MCVCVCVRVCVCVLKHGLLGASPILIQCQFYPHSLRVNQPIAGVPHHNASDKDKTDPDKPAAVARAANKPTSNTPARPSSALKTRQANSTPRVRSRHAPARSLSTPLARSLSVRVSNRDRRWIERQSDPKSPISTTYKVTPTAFFLFSFFSFSAFLLFYPPPPPPPIFVPCFFLPPTPHPFFLLFFFVKNDRSV